MKTRIVFDPGTPIRCNRGCEMNDPAPRGFWALRENDRCWRMQDMMVHPACGHLDAHWVFKIDVREA